MELQAFMFSGATPFDADVVFAADNTILILYKPETKISSYVIPDGVVKIMPDAFRRHEELTNIAFPDSLEHIGEDAFRGCKGLMSVSLPNGIEQIDCGAFWDCANLTNIIIPDGIKYIGDYAFHGCESLQSVVFKNKTYNAIIRDCYCNRKGRDLPQEFYDFVNEEKLLGAT